jgi:O-acetyl-ADP-ribose deacetylase
LLKKESQGLLELQINKSRLALLEGDITEETTDVIVNAANKLLSPGGGICGAIHSAAGSRLWKESRLLGGCKTGEAKITKGYNLKAKYVIHTVGPVYSSSPEDIIKLTNSYRNSLEVAQKNNLKSISFPSISTGIFGYPVLEAAEIAIKTIIDFLKENSEIELVQIVLFDENTHRIYKEAALKL